MIYFAEYRVSFCNYAVCDVIKFDKSDKGQPLVPTSSSKWRMTKSLDFVIKLNAQFNNFFERPHPVSNVWIAEDGRYTLYEYLFIPLVSRVESRECPQSQSANKSYSFALQEYCIMQV